jgi:undecaprenyl-diphosphatase
MQKIKTTRGLQVSAFLAFAILAVLVATGWTQSTDAHIANWIHTHSSPWLNDVMALVTKFGNAEILAPVAILTAALLWRFRRQSDGWFVLGSVATVSLVNVGLKQIFQRQRPDLWPSVITESGFSFPSGHAMATSAFVFALVFLAWNTRWRIPAVVAAAIIIPLIGFSRVYLGVHYPADVVGGWLISLALVLTLGASKFRTWFGSKAPIGR